MKGLRAKRMQRDSQMGLRYSADGLVIVVAVDSSTREALMLAYASREAVARTLARAMRGFSAAHVPRFGKKGDIRKYNARAVSKRGLRL